MCPYVANVIIPCILKSILMRKTIRSKMCKNKKGTDCIHKIGHVYTKVELSMFPLLWDLHSSLVHCSGCQEPTSPFAVEPKKN